MEHHITKTAVLAVGLLGTEIITLYTEPGCVPMTIVPSGPASIIGEPMRYMDTITVDGRTYQLGSHHGQWEFSEVRR